MDVLVNMDLPMMPKTTFVFPITVQILLLGKNPIAFVRMDL
jgi:hypothetical protein